MQGRECVYKQQTSPVFFTSNGCVLQPAINTQVLQPINKGSVPQPAHAFCVQPRRPARAATAWVWQPGGVMSRADPLVR
eukprot:scaffold238705_cov17-Tisochrysis_lutea.AAC.1